MCEAGDAVANESAAGDLAVDGAGDGDMLGVYCADEVGVLEYGAGLEAYWAEEAAADVLADYADSLAVVCGVYVDGVVGVD